VLLAVEGLKPTTTATTVRSRDGKAIVLDEAVEWAERIPTSCKGGSGCIEIRPVADLPQPPTLA
jgi:hypothetical protein